MNKEVEMLGEPTRFEQEEKSDARLAEYASQSDVITAPTVPNAAIRCDGVLVRLEKLPIALTHQPRSGARAPIRVATDTAFSGHAPGTETAASERGGPLP
jgi:hypothetical protein